jgi:hypothetical protein
MDSNTWSLILSLAGLVLGFVSAYGQIRNFTAKLFSFSADAAKRWAKRRNERIEIFASHPSALVAHVSSVGLSVVFALLITGVGLSLLKQYFPDTPPAIRQAVSFASGLFVGGQIGALSLLINSIKARIFNTNRNDRYH